MINPVNNISFKAIYHRNNSEEIIELMQKTQYNDALSIIMHSDRNKNEVIGDFFLATDDTAKKIREESTKLLQEKASFSKVIDVLTKEFFEKLGIKPKKEKDIRLIAVDEITHDVLDFEHRIKLFSPDGQLEL